MSSPKNAMPKNKLFFFALEMNFFFACINFFFCANFRALFNIATFSLPIEFILGKHHFYYVPLDCANMNFFFAWTFFYTFFCLDRHFIQEFLFLAVRGVNAS